MTHMSYMSVYKFGRLVFLCQCKSNLAQCYFLLDICTAL